MCAKLNIYCSAGESVISALNIRAALVKYSKFLAVFDRFDAYGKCLIAGNFNARSKERENLRENRQ